jgi:hypothetical protein
LPDNLEPINILAIGYSNEKAAIRRHHSWGFCPQHHI